MNLDSYNYNVPAFVSEADPSNFDISSPGAVVFGGFRLDNPAAAWVAGAEMRKHASELDAAVCEKINTALDLFGLSEEHYSIQKLASVEISDGENTAEFSIYDNDSLNTAAKELLDKRASLPYSFAHDCAVAICSEANKGSFRFDDTVVVPIRKLAGDYSVDFEAGNKLLKEASDKADELGFKEHADVLRKLASMCTDKCSTEAAPYFIAALDEFNRSGVVKEATADRPENLFYLSNAEQAARKAAQELRIDSTRSIRSGDISSPETKSRISKWASMCGYSISSNEKESAIVDAVAKMPETLREEFVELFG